ncbi:G-type lectin S-receptor-like serine/threonine-protein kinase At1g61370 [Linum perenne]
MHSSIFHTTSKITSLARSGFLSQARKLFDEMPSRDTVAWNSMLTSYSQLGFHREALSLFHNHMRLSGSKPDGFTFTATLNACAGLGSFRSGTKLHALVIVLGCQTLLPVNNSLVDMYGKCFDPVSAGNVFKEMSFANEVSWCSLLFAYTNSGLFCEADEVFRLMPRKIDVAWNIMISGFGQCGEIELCVDFVRQMRLSSCFPDQFTYSTLINACAECLESGFGFMIHGIAIRSGWSSAMEVKNSIFNLYAKLGFLTEAEKVFQFQSSGMLTQVSWNSIIDAYMKSGDTDKAFLAFRQMPEKNLVSWTSMIAGYAQKGLGEEALNMFSYMVRDGLLPDDFTLGAALHACSTLASINYGRMLHGCVVHSGFSTYAYIQNGLVNMYAKCGDLDSSMMAFDISRKSVVSLNTMIFSLGLHGRGNQALHLYEDMIESGIKPDKVTFIGLLMTCSHSGMVEKGRMLFDSMSSDHGVPHEADHVACMVDLLSRAGYSSEAKELAGKYQDSSHGELKLSQPSYVLQSNMYSASGEWERAELVRKAMADEGLKKPPGCSWIEVRNEVACFVAVDSSSSSSTLIRTEELFQSALSEGCSSVRLFEVRSISLCEMNRAGFALFLFLTNFLLCSSLTNNLTSSSLPLLLNQTLTSQNEVYELGFFAPDRNRSRNLYLGVRFKQTSPQTIVWVANREAPVTEESARLLVNGDGNLELQDGRRRRIWGTNFTSSSNSTAAILQNDGNFALITGSGERLWQSGDNSGDTLIEGKWLMFNQSNPTARPFRLNSWKSAGDPSPGSFTVGFLLQSPPQATISKDGNPYWRSGPWDRARFINIPDMDTDYQSSLTLIEDQGLVYLSLIPPRNCTYTTFQMTWTGSLQLRCWDRIRGWYTRFETPKSECEVYGACGENGVCGRDDPLKCDCIRGFVPKSEEEWKVGNWSRGCVRRTASVCSRNASSNGAGDGFLKMSGVNVPEVYEFMRVWDGSECSRQSVLGTLAVAALVLCLIIWKKRRVKPKGKTENYSGSSTQRLNYMQKGNPDEQESFELPMFDLESIEFATNGFDISNLLGRGGFGPVYLGKLPDGKIVAIKRLSTSSGQGADEFKNEIMLISKLQHRNLVRLLGCCVDGLEKMLIYEFMPNKSLDTYLFDSTKKAELDWPIRMNIIHGIARGLLYLHRDSLLRIIHRDLKVSNILLDEKMNPKISDFGLARIFEGTQDLASTHKVVGTLGYMSPEYLLAGMFSDKSDVFSFGVLLLEIVSGLLCVQDHATDRPTMAAVVSMLSGEMSLPRPNQPTFTFQNKTPNVNNFFPGGGQSSSAEKWSPQKVQCSDLDSRFEFSNTVIAIVVYIAGVDFACRDWCTQRTEVEDEVLNRILNGPTYWAFEPAKY